MNRADGVNSKILRKPKRRGLRWQAARPVAWLAAATLLVAAGSLTWQQRRSEQVRSTTPSRTDSVLETLLPHHKLPDRLVYPYSVVPGGVENASDVKQAIDDDPVVREHYRGFNWQRAMAVTLSEPRLVYVSYRKNNKVFYTKNKVTLQKGEKVLTDGVSMLRGRCGNRIADTPQTDIALTEPTEEEMNSPQLPVLALLSPPIDTPFQAPPSDVTPGVPVTPDTPPDFTPPGTTPPTPPPGGYVIPPPPGGGFIIPTPNGTVPPPSDPTPNPPSTNPPTVPPTNPPPVVPPPTGPTNPTPGTPTIPVPTPDNPSPTPTPTPDNPPPVTPPGTTPPAPTPGNPNTPTPNGPPGVTPPSPDTPGTPPPPTGVNGPNPSGPPSVPPPNGSTPTPPNPNGPPIVPPSVLIPPPPDGSVTPPDPQLPPDVPPPNPNGPPGVPEPPPIPEPSTYALMAGGLALMGFLHHRRGRR